jgi:hypothetical protein
MANAFGGSNPSLPTGRKTRHYARHALIAQLVEHALGKGGVMGSTPIEGSTAEENIMREKERKNGEAKI